MSSRLTCATPLARYSAADTELVILFSCAYTGREESNENGVRTCHLFCRSTTIFVQKSWTHAPPVFSPVDGSRVCSFVALSCLASASFQHTGPWSHHKIRKDTNKRRRRTSHKKTQKKCTPSCQLVDACPIAEPNVHNSVRVHAWRRRTLRETSVWKERVNTRV